MTALQIEFNLSKTHDTIDNTRTNYFFFETLYIRNIMMKNTMSKVITASLLSCVAFSFAHAADENTSKAEVKKQIQVCAKKKKTR